MKKVKRAPAASSVDEEMKAGLITALKEAVREEVGSLREEVGSLRKEVGGLREEVGSLRKQSASIEERLDHLTERIDETEAPRPLTWAERADQVNVDGKERPLYAATGSTITGAGVRARGQAGYLLR